eukprot:CAMPEP_0119152804 /NCGR_PEP_ID=MMETSP1310-20130426/48329_1 /TAXON_ID=464262 /ORGANISM="Genus nov. species nov., Strain RCC2339" /LENGTH=539 /DNA_ID=CAMNT_0007145209 /DNA_START=127 /DNA_END=1746 /DNA_ORIENTATION=+
MRGLHLGGVVGSRGLRDCLVFSSDGQRARCKSSATPKRGSGCTSSSEWETVIGVEIHIQLSAYTKIFSDAPFRLPMHGDLPNSNVSPLDFAYPGTLPVLNEEVLRQGIRTAYAFGSNIAQVSTFDRKHYCWPDLPQGYQITQHFQPFATGGFVSIGSTNPRSIGLVQLQLEQDTAKTTQEPGMTLLDHNRAGVGLLELVSAPELRSATDTADFCVKVQSILRYLGSSTASLEEGSMRCDVNVSVNRPGEPWGTRCEIKNLNTVRHIRHSIRSEVSRHIALLEKGGRVMPETRGYDPGRDTTYTLRRKETAPDYRFMPDPDLPPLILSQTYLDEVRKTIPVLPDQHIARLVSAPYSLSRESASMVAAERNTAEFFWDAVAEAERMVGSDTRVITEVLGNLMVQEIPHLLDHHGVTHGTSGVLPGQVASVVAREVQGKVTRRVAKDILRVMYDGHTGTADEIIQQRGIAVVSDKEELSSIIDAVLAENADAVATYRTAPPPKAKRLVKFFVGAVMKKTKGQADAVSVHGLLVNAHLPKRDL